MAQKRAADGALPPGQRARVATSTYDFLDYELDEDGILVPEEDAEPDEPVRPMRTSDPATTAAVVNGVRERWAGADSVTATDVPFELSREPDRVVDVGELLRPLPSAAIEALATECPRALLTEPPEHTDRRVELRLFEQHTRCMRGTRAAHWVKMLAPWAGVPVVRREPVVADSAPLCCAWQAADNPQRTYSLAIFELRPAFYVAAVLRTDFNAADCIYVGAFYMQSEQSHAADGLL